MRPLKSPQLRALSYRSTNDYFVVVVVVDVAGAVVVVVDGDAISVDVVVVDGGVVDVVVDVVVSLGAGVGTATTVVDEGGVLTTAGGLLTTVGFSHALTTTTASDAANNIEYFMFISPDVQKEVKSPTPLQLPSQAATLRLSVAGKTRPRRTRHPIA